MKQLLAFKRGSKYYLKIYGAEYELVLPSEVVAKPLSENLKKKIAGKTVTKKK
mgnify:CR=1 FL=1